MRAFLYRVAPSDFAPTCPTESLATEGQAKIGSREGVAIYAMGFAGVLGGEAGSPKDIDSRRHGLKVCRANTMAHTAQMVKCQARGDGADKKFVGEAVNADWFTADAESGIAPWAQFPSPQPATIRLLDPSPETFLRGVRPSPSPNNVFRVPVGSQAVIVHVAPPAYTRGLAAIGNATLWEHRKVPPFGVTQPEVIGLAAAFIIPELVCASLFTCDQNGIHEVR